MTGPRGDMAPDVGGLGEKVQKPPAQPPERLVPTGTPGVVRNTRTGKLETELPEPPGTWPFPTGGKP